MPDISAPIFTPSASLSISNIDLDAAINKSPTLSARANTPIDTGLSSAIPFEFDNKKYGQPLRVFDENQLGAVAGYNSFKDTPTYNPELSSMQNIRGYAAKQGTGEWLANNFMKLGKTAKDSFISTFEQNGRNFQALTKWDASKLYDTTDNTIEQEALRNKYPTYGTGELDNSLRRFLPWNFGKSDFGGEMLPQLGFTIGTMGETLLENWAVGMATGGLGEAYEAGKTASNIGRVGQGLLNLFETANGITNFKKGLQVLNTIKQESSLGATIGQGAIKGAKLLANAYSMFNTAGGEAAFEANNTYTEQIKDLTDEYKTKNGYAPFGQDLDKIKETAQKTATATFGWNIPVLLGSNLIQFGNILKPFKGVLAETTEDVAMELVGKGLKKTVATVAEKEVESGLGKILKTAGKAAKALAEPGSEGLEEVLQSTGSTYAQQYYKDLYNGLSVDSALNDSLNSVFHYAGSKSFQDDFFGGFLGGAIFKGVGAISARTGIQERLGFDTDKSREDRKTRITNQAIEILNSTSNEDLIKYLFDPTIQNYIAQTGNKDRISKASQADDRLAFNDAKSEAIRDLIYSGLITGKMDLALSKLEVFKELDNDELAQALNIQDKADIDQSLTKASQVIEDIKKRAYDLQADWSTIDRKYKNPYAQGTAEHIMFNQAKRDRLFSKDRVLDDQKRAKNLRRDILSTSRVTDNVIDQAVDPKVLNKAIDDLDTYVTDAPDKNNLEYDRRKSQLGLLKDIKAEKAKKSPDFKKLAELVFDLGNINELNVDFGVDRDTNIDRIKDILKLEDRHAENVADYNFLNGKDISESMQEHLAAANLVIEKLKEKAKIATVPPTTETSPTTASTTTAAIVTTPEVLPTTGETEDAKTAEESVNQGSSKLARIKFATDRTPPSEQLSTSNPIDNQFHRRKDKFLEDLHLNALPNPLKKGKFWDRKDVKVMVVTPNNFTKYGKNLGSVLNNQFNIKKPIDQLTKEEYKALDNASVMFLFVVEDNKEWKPIKYDGTLLPVLDGTSDYKIQDLTYTFNETSTEDNYKNVRNDNNTPLKELIKLHRNQRYKWLTQDTAPQAFQISHGIPNMEKKNGKTVRIQNTVQDVNLLPDNHIYNADDLYISTSKDEFEKTNTNLISDRYLRPGRPYLPIKDKNNNVVDYQKLENSPLTANQKGSLLYSFKSLIDDFFANDQLVELNETNPNYNFIKHLLFLQEKDPYKDENSIQIVQDVKGEAVTIKYDFTNNTPKFVTFHKGADTNSIVDNAQFKMWLDKRYLNVRKPSTNKFTEIYVENKTTKTREWDNYTQYLLDSKTPEGVARDVAEIPLKVELYTPAQQDAYYEGGNKYPTKRKQYYIKLGDRVLDDKGNVKKAESNKPIIKNTQPKNSPPPSTGNTMNDLAAILEANKKAAEEKKKKAAKPNNKGEIVGEKINLASLLSTPTEQVKDIVQEEKPPIAEAGDTLSELAKILAANKAKADAKKSGTIESAPIETVLVNEETPEFIDESPFTPDDIAPSSEPEPEPNNIVSLRGRKKSGRNYTRVFSALGNYSKENISQIRDFFKKNLPQVTLDVVDNLIKIADGKLAWGTYSDGVVKLFQEAEAGTGYHEAFEVVYNSILSPKEQASLLREFKGRRGTFSNFATDGDVSYANATDEQAREELAEEFLRYKLNGEVKPDTRNIFQKIWDFIVNFVQNLDSINDVFQKLDRGFYANKELFNTGQTYNRLTGVGAVEEGYYLKGITYEMINKLFADTNSFTEFDEGFNEKKLYDQLYSDLKDFYNSDDEDNPNTYRNVIADLYFPQIEAIENSPKFTDEYKTKLIRPLEIEFTKKLNAQRERFNTVISFQWEQLVREHKTYLKQLGVINFVEIDDNENNSEGDQESKNSNEYTRNDFKIDTKSTAPASVKLLFNTIAESTFNFEETQTLANGLTIPLIQPKIVNQTGMVNLFDNGGALFNIVLSQASGINTLDGIKAKLEEMLGLDRIEELQTNPEELNKYIQSRLEEEEFKNNSIYTHLFKIYTRVFATPENELTEAEWKQRLKFLSTFSRQKPEFWQLVSGEEDTFMMDELRDTGRKQIINKWMRTFTSNIKDKNKFSILNKANKKEPFILNKVSFDKLIALEDRTLFMNKAAAALGFEEINAAFIENLTGNEQNTLYNNLRTILTRGIGDLWNGKDGRKLFNKITPNHLGVNSPYNDIADIVLDKKGDEVDSIHSNIEGEQQQNIILNNEISNRLASFNRHKTLASYIQENPEFKDSFTKSSILLNKLYDRNGNRTTFSPTVAIVSGTRESSRDNGKKSSNQNLTERLYQEFNVNLEGKFYILLPADAETEWGISVDRNTYLQYSDNITNNLSPFISYLKSEIEVAQQFVNPNDPNHASRNSDEHLSTTRPLRDGTERKVGASLQVFKDILSDELVAKIHDHIDNLVNVDEIITELQSQVNRDLKAWIDTRVNETFLNLNQAKIVERKGREAGQYDKTIQPNSQYVFYGLNSSFNRDVTKFPNNKREVTTGKHTETKTFKNEYVLTSAQVRNLIAFREMSYAINNIEMTKLFVGNPYFYKDIQKRVKSFLSTTENSYVQNTEDTHKADDWFNRNLNRAKYTDEKGNVQEVDLTNHPHTHEFTSNIKTWVFKDHETLNKELSNFNSKYAANNATDAQSFITPNGYREFYWKSGAKFRNSQEKQFQIEQAFERFLLDDDGVFPYTDAKLKALDQKILEGHVIETDNGYELSAKFDVFEVFKPKGSGTLGNVDTFDPYIWKTSVAFFNYRMVRGTPLENAYLQMLNEKVSVLTFESAIKVGLKKDPKTNKINSLIESKSFQDLGKVASGISNNAMYLPFKSVGLQVETSTQKSKGTIGTQTTKLIITDLFEYGVPTDYEKDNADFSERMSKWYALSDEEKLASSNHYRLEKEHQKAIENLEDVGYYNLLDRLGIKEIDNNGTKSYQYEDLSKVYDLLKEEMVKRGLSSNIYDMFDDLSLKVKPIEALSNYAQASFIIMSVVRKSIIRPKLNGGQKIQASSVLLNQIQGENLQASYYNKATKTWEDITTEEQFNTVKASGAKIMYNSSQLKFYSKKEDGSLNVMEVMLPNIFRDKIAKYRKSKGLEQISDDELLTWLNENQPKLLEGIGFRIPTQALSSIDTFKIKGFLPSYFGDTVVVPSELTTKVGSDFDVDKLNTYLNNFVINSKGYPVYVKAYSSIEEAKAGFADEFETKIAKQLGAYTDKKVQFRADLLEALQYQSLEYGIPQSKQIDKFTDKYYEVIDDLLEENDDDAVSAANAVFSTIDRLNINYTKITDQEWKAVVKELYVNKRLKESMENNYFSIIDQILKLPQNFDKMLAPNNSDEFDKEGALRDKIMESIGQNKDNLEKIPKEKRGKYINYSNILDSNRMRYNRWAFVIGKKGVGIAALSATNHINSQKIGFKLETPTMSKSGWWSNKIYGKDVVEPELIKFKHNKLTHQGREISVLSGITKVEGENISEFVSKYVNGYVDVSKDAWILDIGAQMEVAGIYLFMERLGINSEEIIYFLNQPIIKYYLNASALKNSPIRNINPDVKAQAQASNTDDKIYELVKQMLIGTKTIKPVSSFKLKDLKDNIEKYSKFPMANWKTNGTIPNSVKEQQFLIFKHFLQLKDYSNYIRASQTASNHDTAHLNSLHILDDKDDTLDGLLSPYTDKFITTIDNSTPMAYALRTRTFVGNVYDKLNTLDTQFLSKAQGGLFRIQSKNVRRTLRAVMNNVIPGAKWLSENDRREMMDKITKVAINSLVMNTEINGKTPLIESLDKVMTVENLRGIISKVQDIVKNPNDTYKQELKDANIDLAHIISNTWINQLIVEPIANDSKFGYLTISGKKPSDNFEKQVWIEDFRKLKQLPFTRKLYQAILSGAIYQAGAEHNRSSLLDLIPWQDYTPILNAGLDNLSLISKNDITRTIAKLKHFDKSYFTPLEYISAGEVNGKKYYAKSISLFGKDKDNVEVSNLNGLFPPGQSPYWLAPKEHTNAQGEKVKEISHVVLVPQTRYYEAMNFFTLKQQDSSYTGEEVKAMREAKNFDYFTTLLLEKAPMTYSNGLETYLIFRPINTTGNRYIQETLFNNDYSKLDTHEKVNPHLTNDDVLYKILSTKFPGNIKKTEAFPEAAPIIVTEQDPTSQESNVTEDIEFEDVPDENKELPNSQKLLEAGTPEEGESIISKEDKLKDLDTKIRFAKTQKEADALVKEYEDLAGDVWFPFQLNAYNDLFDNPQTANRIKEKANEALNNKLIDYLKKYNVSVEKVNSIKDKYGVDAAGVVDILNRTILLDENKQGLDTLPEEAAHVFTMMMAASTEMDWMKENIDKWEGYKQVYSDYYAQYEGKEDRIKFEAVGKFIALHLIKNEPTVSEEIKSGIFERLWKFIKELFGDRTDIEKLNSIADSIANKVLNDEALVDTSIKEGFSKVNTDKAFKDNFQAKLIHEKMKDKFLLSGSAALATQGEVWRADENPLHDLDYISTDTSIDVTKTIKGLFLNAQSVHPGILNTNYTTKAFLIPPTGITVREITYQDRGDYKGWITGYKLYDKKNKQVGLYETKFENGKLLKRQEGIAPQWVDVFEYKKQSDVNLQPSVVEGFSNWDRIFNAKLDMARDKDIRDWLNFKTPYKLNEFDNIHTYYSLFSPDDLPSIDRKNQVEGTCE